jgi:hypothetical protein
MNIRSSLQHVCIIGLFFSLSSSAAEVSFKSAQFHLWAHKMMSDHGANALYTIFLDDVDEFLPIKNGIKRRMVKLINDRWLPGKSMVKHLRHRIFYRQGRLKWAMAKDFFCALREGIPYTYVILPYGLSFTESTNHLVAEKFKNIFSKHYLISGLTPKVNFAGEFHVYKNHGNHEVFLVFDNSSGTYRPPNFLLPDLKELLENNFAISKEGIFFVVKSFNQKINQAKLFNHDQQPFID